MTAVVLLNVAIMAQCLRESGAIKGFDRIQDMYSPFTIGTYLIDAVLVSPALLMFGWAD